MDNLEYSKLSKSSNDLFAYYPGIDVVVGLTNTLDDEDLFKEILILFYQNHGLDGEKLHKALLTGDIKSARFLIHTLKGVACSVGAIDLFNVLNSSTNTDDISTFDSSFEQGVLFELNKVLLGIKLQLIK